MSVLPEWLRYVQNLDQQITGVPDGTPSPLLLEIEPTQYIVSYTAEEWRQLFDCILMGSNLLYPDISHQIMWDWLRPVEFPYEFPQGVAVMDVVEVGGQVNAAPHTNPQSVVAGWNKITDFAAVIIQDSTGEATASSGNLYLPAGRWAYQMSQYWQGSLVNTAKLAVAVPDSILDAVQGVGSRPSNGWIDTQGFVDVDAGEAATLWLNAQTTGQLLGTVANGAARYHKGIFWRVISSTTPEDPEDPEYPLLTVLTASWPVDFTITHGTFQVGSGLHADPYDANSDQARFVWNLGASYQLTRITAYYDSTGFPTSGLGQNIWSIAAYNGGGEQFEQLGTPQPNQTGAIMQWTGSQTDIDEIRVLLRHRSASGDAWLTALEIDGVGTPP